MSDIIKREIEKEKKLDGCFFFMWGEMIQSQVSESTNVKSYQVNSSKC